MEWFKKHVDTVVILSGIIGSMMWMNGKFGEMDQKFHEIEKDMAIMKTVLIMKEVMPKELAKE